MCYSMPKKRRQPPVSRLERPVSLVGQVEHALRRAVEEQVFADGRLPTEVELAEQFGVSRETVRRAAEVLQREGLLRKYRRRGTVVQAAPPGPMVATPKASRLLAYVQAEYRDREGRVEGVTTGITGAMFEGAAAEAARADYEFVFRTTTAGDLRAVVERLVERYRIAGIVAASFAEEKAFRKLGARELPVVLLDHDLAVPKVSSIREDSAAGSRAAVEHLAALGHRRIALAHWHQTDLNPWRLRGYREALRAARLGVRRRYELTTEITPAGAASIVKQLAAEEPRPTAVVCFNNTLARFVCEAAQAQGWSVPGDLSVVGCGGEEVLGLTTCQSDWAGLGRRAVALLLGRLQSGDAAPAPIEHEQPVPTLRIGTSTAPPPVDGR